jgi:hypothetical protein
MLTNRRKFIGAAAGGLGLAGMGDLSVIRKLFRRPARATKPINCDIVPISNRLAYCVFIDRMLDELDHPYAVLADSPIAREWAHQHSLVSEGVSTAMRCPMRQLMRRARTYEFFAGMSNVLFFQTNYHLRIDITSIGRCVNFTGHFVLGYDQLVHTRNPRAYIESESRLAVEQMVERIRIEKHRVVLMPKRLVPNER